MTPLMYSSIYGCVKTTKALLDLNAAIDDSNVDGETPLLLAIRYNKCSVVELFMDTGCNVNLRDNNGACVLETAARFSSKDCVKVLCTHERYVDAMLR